MLLTGCTGWLGQTIVPFFQERYDCDVLSRQPGTNLPGDARTVKLQHSYDYIIHGALDGAKNIIDQAGDAKVLFMSSGAVYRRQTEYADAKRRDEAILWNHAAIARLFTFIGPNMPTHYAAGEFLACARERRTLVVRNPNVVRSYLHVDDLPPILERLLISGYPGMTTDVGSTEPVTMLKLAHKIAQVSGCPVTIEPGNNYDKYLPNLSAGSIDTLIMRSL